MSAFTPSANFSKHWLSIPAIARQAFYQELSDIIELLKSDTPTQDFRFYHANFDKEIAQLLHIYDEPATPTPSTPTLDENTAQALYQDLSNRIDDILSEQMAQMSEDLKAWLRTAISDALSQKS